MTNMERQEKLDEFEESVHHPLNAFHLFKRRYFMYKELKGALEDTLKKLSSRFHY